MWWDGSLALTWLCSWQLVWPTHVHRATNRGLQPRDKPIYLYITFCFSLIRKLSIQMTICSQAFPKSGVECTRRSGIAENPHLHRSSVIRLLSTMASNSHTFHEKNKDSLFSAIKPLNLEQFMYLHILPFATFAAECIPEDDYFRLQSCKKDPIELLKYVAVPCRSTREPFQKFCPQAV